MSEKPLTPRIYAILAREANLGVVFRRGPSKQVMLAKWFTDTDIFECGQWLKARVYERQCDLSPDGELLIYPGSNQRKIGYLANYTAISKPPYFTALALWNDLLPGGGGLFETRDRVLLNHEFYYSKPDKRFKLPANMRVELIGNDVSNNRDRDLLHKRLTRDGWSGGDKEYIRVKSEYCLKMMIEPHGTNDGEWQANPYATRFEISFLKNDFLFSLNFLDWADWDKNDDLLFARDGKLFRLKSQDILKGDIALAKMLIDLSPLQFRPLVADEKATEW